MRPERDPESVVIELYCDSREAGGSGGCGFTAAPFRDGGQAAPWKNACRGIRGVADRGLNRGLCPVRAVHMLWS